MSNPQLSEAKKRRTKQTLQAPRQVQEKKVKKESLSLGKTVKKLIWVSAGKAEHQAWLLEDLGDKKDVLVQWESTRGKELVSVSDIRLEMPSRRSRQRNAQITDMKKLLSPSISTDFQRAETAKKKKQTEIKLASSKSSEERKKKKRRQKAGAPKSYADTSEFSESEFKSDRSRNASKYDGTSESDVDFEFNEEAAPGESSDEEEFDMNADELDVLPRSRSSSPSPERPVTRKRPRLSVREHLSDEYDSDLLDSEGDLLLDDLLPNGDDCPNNSDDDEDPVIIKKSKYIKRISLTPRLGGGYDAEIMDSYHFPKLGSKALPKPQIALAALPLHVSLSNIDADSSDDEAEISRTIERVSKRKLSDAAETSNNNSNNSGKEMSTKDDKKVEMEVDPLANELPIASEGMKAAAIPASATFFEKNFQESIVKVSTTSVSSLPSLVPDTQTGTFNDNTKISGNLPVSKEKAESDTAIVSRANERVVSKRLVAPTTNYILGSRGEARPAGSTPAKAATSKKPADVPEKISVSRLAEKATTSVKAWQKPSDLDVSDTESDSSDDEDARIKRAHAWMEIANKKNTIPRLQSDKSKAAARKPDVMQPPGPHKTTTNDTENQERQIQEAAGKRVSASTVGTTSDDNTDLPKKSVLLRPPSGPSIANERSSSKDKSEIEKNKNQSSVVKKFPVSSSLAKAVATTDDIDSSDDEAELRRTRKQDAMQPLGPHKTTTNGAGNQERQIQEAAGKRASASTVQTASVDNTDLPKKSVMLRPSSGLWRANDRNSSDDKSEIDKNKNQSSVVKKFPVSSSLAKAVATTDDIDSSDDEAELRRARSTGPSASSNTLSSTHQRASPYEKGGSVGSPESRASPAKPTGKPDSYDVNSSDDEAEIRRTEERMMAPPSAAPPTSRAKQLLGAGASSDDEAELRRRKRRKSSPNRKKSTERKGRRIIPLGARRRPASFTIDTESPFKKASASRISRGNCICFSRAGAQCLKRLLVKDFADRVATWAVKSSRETMVAGSATIQESPDIF